jgi:hypothetical protein
LGLSFEGIDPATGNAIITDQDNNGLINVEDKIEAGSGLPDYQYGLTLSASYKNISLTAFGQGLVGTRYSELPAHISRTHSNTSTTEPGHRKKQQQLQWHQ